MITIKELAALCGVSISTVSRAMNARADVNAATRETILAAAKEHGYVPNTAARNLKIPPTRTVAVIVQGQTSELLIKLLGYIDEGLQMEGYETFLCHVSDRKANAETIENLILGGNYAGVIFLGRYGDVDGTSSGELSHSLSRLEVPFVFCTTADFSTSPKPRPSVKVDDSGGAGALTEALLDLGHTRIAYALVDPEDSLQGEHAWMLRYQGYKKALEARGLEADPELQIPAVDASQPYSMSNAYESTAAWLKTEHPQPTAIVASCDAVAVGVIRALFEAGVDVPGEMSVTGFDGLDFALYSHPSIATIIQPIEAIAENTVSSLLHLFEGIPFEETRMTIQGEMRMGETAAAPHIPSLADV